MLMEDTFDSSGVTGEVGIIFDNMAAQNIEGLACFGSDEWPLLAEKRRHLNTGKSNETR
jgi:hypothetical protein